MSKPRIIFDRSAFHGHRFDNLAKSRLLALSQARRISIYHTASLIEETVSLYLKQTNRPILKKQLPFILDICNARWLQATDVIWRKELIERCVSKQVIFMPDAQRKHMQIVLQQMALQDLIDPNDLKEIGFDKSQVKERSLQLRNTLAKMRHKVAEKKKALKKQMKIRIPPFASFIDSELDSFGRGVLTKHLDGSVSEKQDACERWSMNKTRYPYVTAFMKGILYAVYYSMVEPNGKLDVNTQMDVEQLTYLHGVDILVSNDMKFMKAAFDALWRPKGKRYMTTEEFICYIESL